MCVSIYSHPQNNKNIVRGSIYRHPHNNFDEFFQYV